MDTARRDLIRRRARRARVLVPSRPVVPFSGCGDEECDWGGGMVHMDVRATIASTPDDNTTPCDYVQVLLRGGLISLYRV